MNEAIAKRWIENLTNGKHRKTKNRLKDSNGFCCLGVLCDMYRQETGIGSWTKIVNEDAYE
ncbi:MAG: hypothetical protein AABY07_00825, partial [Nanoarchaeota archaeon]